MDERRAELILEREKRIEAVGKQTIMTNRNYIVVLLQGDTVEDDEIEQTLASEFQVNPLHH